MDMVEMIRRHLEVAEITKQHIAPDARAVVLLKEIERTEVTWNEAGREGALRAAAYHFAAHTPESRLDRSERAVQLHQDLELAGYLGGHGT